MSEDLRKINELKNKFEDLKQNQMNRLAKLKNTSLVNTTPMSPFQFSGIPSNNDSPNYVEDEMDFSDESKE